MPILPAPGSVHRSVRCQPLTWLWVSMVLMLIAPMTPGQATATYFEETARFPYLFGQSSGLTWATPADLDGNGFADLIITDWGIPQF